MKNTSITLLLSDARGGYIPRDFVTSFDVGDWNVSAENAAICENPEHEQYWDAWDEILGTAYYKDNNDNIFRLHQDGDLWAYCIEKMTLEEQHNLFQLSSLCDYVYSDDCTLFEVGSQFMCALVNGDYSDIEEYEESELNDFTRINGNDVVDYIADYKELGQCEVTGMRENTSLVLIRNRS